jgi:hypothetical protein
MWLLIVFLALNLINLLVTVYIHFGAMAATALILSSVLGALIFAAFVMHWVRKKLF